ncbi:MAG: hypothetical protein AAF547_06590 [Actinomycetota bacterium]
MLKFALLVLSIVILVTALPVEHAEPHISVDSTDPEHRQRVAEAVSRFEAHGLVLPALRVSFFTDETACRGYFGLFQASTSPWSVRVCSDLDFVVTHELAHAYLALHLNDADRAAYLAAYDLPTWNGREVEWRQRGFEDAAFVLQQNLMMPPRDADGWSAEWERRAEAYELLTGRPSPLRG